MQQLLIYTGRSTSQVADTWPGFRVGKVYPITYTEADGRVTVEIPDSPGKTIEMSSEEFAARFRKTAGK